MSMRRKGESRHGRAALPGARGCNGSERVSEVGCCCVADHASRKGQPRSRAAATSLPKYVDWEKVHLLEGSMSSRDVMEKELEDIELKLESARQAAAAPEASERAAPPGTPARSA